MGEELIRNVLRLNKRLVLTKTLSYQIPDGAVQGHVDTEQGVFIK